MCDEEDTSIHSYRSIILLERMYRTYLRANGLYIIG